jgi:CRP/FNR family transcriptional regulator
MYSNILKSRIKKYNTYKTYNKIKKGLFLFSELEPIDEFYIIKSGKVKITKIIDNKEITLSVIEKGFVIGEMSILSNEPKSASVIAIEDTEFLTITKDNFDIVFSLQPKIAKIILKKYCNELWKMIRKEEWKSIANPLNKVLDFLFYEYQENVLDKTDFDNYKFEIDIKELFALCGIIDDRCKLEIKKFLRNDVLYLNNNDIHLTSKKGFFELVKHYKLKNIDNILSNTLKEIGINITQT